MNNPKSGIDSHAPSGSWGVLNLKLVLLKLSFSTAVLCIERWKDENKYDDYKSDLILTLILIAYYNFKLTV